MTIVIHSRKKRIKINPVKFLFSFLIIAGIVTGGFSMFSKAPVAHSANETCDVVCVTAGDTLWSIALSYNDGSHDTRKIVKDILSHNDLTDSSVYMGQVIEIPAKYCS